MIKIVFVQSDNEFAHVRTLFNEYAETLGFGLCFQDFQTELENLSGQYTASGGCLLLAYYDSELAGCVGLRKITRAICEMKRLYTRARFRGKGIGRKLAETVIKQARKAGYKAMRLDTTNTMTEAITLYRSLGFYEIESYRHNPIEGARFFELKL